MTPTAKQLAISKMVQNKNWLEWKTNLTIRGELVFGTTHAGDKILVSASDTGSVSWPTKTTHIILAIGKRGGITVHHASQI